VKSFATRDTSIVTPGRLDVAAVNDLRVRRLIVSLRWAAAVGLIASFAGSAPWLPRPSVWFLALVAFHVVDTLAAASDWKRLVDWLRLHGFAVSLGGIVLVGACMRLSGISGDLGHTPVDVDENRLARSVLSFFRTGQIDHSTTENYPGIAFWLLAGSDLFVYLTALTQGAARDLNSVPFERFVLGGRVTNVMLGAGTIAFAGLLGQKLGGQRSGLVAALVVAVSPLSVEISGLLRNEAAQVFFIVASAWAAVTLAGMIPETAPAGAGTFSRVRDTRLAALAGGIAGAATAVKYTAVFALLPALLAATLVTVAEKLRGAVPWSRAWRLPALVLLAFFAVLATTNHFVWADFPNFVRQLSAEATHSGAAHHWATPKDPLWFYSKTLGKQGPGWVLLVLAAGYAIWGLGTGRTAPLVFLAFPLPYIWFMSQRPLQFPRWVYPVVPFVAVAGATALWAFVDRAQRWRPFGTGRASVRPPPWLMGALVLAALTQPLWRGAVLLSRLTTTPTYGLVEAWLRDHAADGDRVLLEEGWLNLKGTALRLSRVPRLAPVLNGGIYPLYYNDWVVVPERYMGRRELERLRLAANFKADNSFGGNIGFDFAVYATPRVRPIQEAVDFALDQDEASKYLGSEWPMPERGSLGRRLPGEGARLYLPPLGYSATRLDIELEVTGSPAAMIAPADSLPASIAVDLEDEPVPVQEMRTDGSRTFWLSAAIGERLLPPRVVAVRLAPRGGGVTRVLRFAVRG
jgi:4-amino-4-deoxy-L-arabinose transferase-like glycosyltransferase